MLPAISAALHSDSSECPPVGWANLFSALISLLVPTFALVCF